MSDWAPQSELAPRLAFERRSGIRFPIEQEVQYRILDARDSLRAHAGKTLNISSSGMLLQTEGTLERTRRIELAVSWPARLDGHCALKLVAVGNVVRAEAGTAAVHIERYEFRTRRPAMLPPELRPF